MTTHADAPPMEVIFLDHPDTHLNEMGARGIGEIGLAGVAAGITASAYHATGVRTGARSADPCRRPVAIESGLSSRVASSQTSSTSMRGGVGTRPGFDTG